MKDRTDPGAWEDALKFPHSIDVSEYDDEHTWHRQYDKPFKPWQIVLVYLGLLGFGILAAIGLAQLVLIFVELIL